MTMLARAVAGQHTAPPPCSTHQRLQRAPSSSKSSIKATETFLSSRSSRRAANIRAAAEHLTPPRSPAGRNALQETTAGSAAAAGAFSSPPLRRKQFDVVALSNLCVDIMVPVEQLPPADRATRKRLLQQLTAQPPSTEQWEVGGNTNFLIASSRLGLKTACIGHLGPDIFGKYMQDILQAERVHTIEPVAVEELSSELGQTLLCFVLVDPVGKHAFCSRYDFGPWPLLSFVRELPEGVSQVLRNTEAVFINGFTFDELPAGVVLGAARTAQASGAAVFFDPGPRSWTFSEGERKAALEWVLDVADVVCMTEEEAEAVTGGQKGAEAQARFILGRPGARTEWCVIKRGAHGAVLVSRTATQLYSQQALQVDVRDTVGCGDSFAAALVLGFTRQHSIPAVMALANAVGAATAMGAGAGRNVADAGRVQQLLRAAVPGCADGRHLDALDALHSSLSSADFE